jgi:F-type H+-transporting ATPase subunit gamma
LPSLKEVRTRIESVKSTEQITSAMKLVAASRLRRTQNAIIALRPYASKLREILQDLSGSLENTESASFSQERKLQKVLLIILTSNRGLCGPFNSNILRSAKIHIDQHYGDLNRQGKLDLFCIGKKGAEHFQKAKYNVVNVNNAIFDQLTFDSTVAISDSLMADFASKKYDRIEVIYNQFKNAAVQKLTIEQFLPVMPAEHASEKKAVQSDYIFEPRKEILLGALVPKVLKIQFYKMILDSFASEHGARMTAMHQATDNAQEILKQLRLSYNKARQAAITKELLEIVSGAEALKG